MSDTLSIDSIISKMCKKAPLIKNIPYKNHRWKNTRCKNTADKKHPLLKNTADKKHPW